MFDQVLSFLNQLTVSTSNPFLLVLVLIGISFLLEDVAAAAGVALATTGQLSWGASFLGVAFGIAFGDVLLYGLGVYCRKIPRLRKKYIDGKEHTVPLKTNLQLAGAIFISRVTPGLRLISYVYMGFITISFPKFILFVSIAVLIWTASLYLISVLFGEVIAMTLGIPIGFATALPLLLLAIVSFLMAKKFAK